MRVGVLGGGQLGRMLALAGHPLGIEVVCYAASDSSAADVSNVVGGDFENPETLKQWMNNVDVVTYESENTPVELLEQIAGSVPVHPSSHAVGIAQDRCREKELFEELGIPVAPWRHATNPEELRQAIEDLGQVVRVKTRTGGYDGKGQVQVENQRDFARAVELVKTAEVIVEQLIVFESEISVIAVRSASGEIRTYPVVENEHRNGILHSSRVPARVHPGAADLATSHARRIVQHLDYTGVFVIELFVTGGRVVANEMAPRVHNSGHWTIEGAETSQFEQHLRAICGYPLGETTQRGRVAMVNIVGGIPNVTGLLGVAGAHPHLYNKTTRAGRKIGHVTVTASDYTQLEDRLMRVERLVKNELS